MHHSSACKYHTCKRLISLRQMLLTWLRRNIESILYSFFCLMTLSGLLSPLLSPIQRIHPFCVVYYSQHYPKCDGGSGKRKRFKKMGANTDLQIPSGYPWPQVSSSPKKLKSSWYLHSTLYLLLRSSLSLLGKSVLA